MELEYTFYKLDQLQSKARSGRPKFNKIRFCANLWSPCRLQCMLSLKQKAGLTRRYSQTHCFDLLGRQGFAETCGVHAGSITCCHQIQLCAQTNKPTFLSVKKKTVLNSETCRTFARVVRTAHHLWKREDTSFKVRENTTSKKLRWFFPIGRAAAQDVGRRPPTRFRVSRTFTDTADLQLLVYTPLAPPSNYLSLSIIIVGLGEMSAPGTSQTVPSCSELGRNRVAAFPPILSFSRDCESRSVCRRVAGDKSSLTKLICWLT